ncbi:MAG: T9SS C-terminal target domain-containing protein [Methanobacteriota archaeon]|nr:MAG: T9SS C-terminal target domain-containing protein [Euryarchaeota archaeon]
MGMKRYLLFLIIMSIAIYPLLADVYYVDDVSSNGNGSFNDPFNNFGDALNAAQPGDTVMVFPGTFNLSADINTVRNGTANQRITIMAYDPADRPVLTRMGRIFNINHQYHTIDGFIMDAQFGDADLMRVRSNADFLILRNCELMNSLRDGIDLSDATDVLIENCEIHHMLAGTYTNQQDAHGIVATGERNLTVRGCNIYYVSGDCFQTDPDRGLPLWDNVLIEDCVLWTGPLPEDAAGFHAGEIPGENAVDTKINPDSISTGYRPRITIRNVESYGFMPGFISTRAAFNIKEQVECVISGVRVYHNEVAFRLRGPGSRGGAHVTIINAIAYDNDRIFRTEDNIELLHIYNGTFDNDGVGNYFQNVAGGYDENGFDLRNCLFMNAKPSDATDPSNLTADSSFFANVSTRDYHLVAGAPAIDTGDDIPEVTEDFEGNPRISGQYDVGAYEYQPVTELISAVDRLIGDYELHQNFPNPFNPTTTISFTLRRSARVHLDIYNILGQRIASLVNETLPVGNYQIRWNGVDERGNALPSGVYFYRMQANAFSVTRRMMLVE